MYFGHKHVETGPNCSHELPTFLKYQMSLKSSITILSSIKESKKTSKVL